jgi:hypothetical protein
MLTFFTVVFLEEEPFFFIAVATDLFYELSSSKWVCLIGGCGLLLGGYLLWFACFLDGILGNG